MMVPTYAASPNAALARLEASAAQAREELARFYAEAALAAVAAALTPEPAGAGEIAARGHNPALLRDDHLAA